VEFTDWHRENMQPSARGLSVEARHSRDNHDALTIEW
jgi:hypothetical protein